MVPLLGVLAALAENASAVPSTHMVATDKSRFRGSDTHFWSPQNYMHVVQTYRGKTPMHIQ